MMYSRIPRLGGCGADFKSGYKSRCHAIGSDGAANPCTRCDNFTMKTGMPVFQTTGRMCRQASTTARSMQVSSGCSITGRGTRSRGPAVTAKTGAATFRARPDGGGPGSIRRASLLREWQA